MKNRLAQYGVECVSVLELEDLNYKRSPIGICDDMDYPIKNRFKLHSVYDIGRVTYIYNLMKYDRVSIVINSKDIPKESMESLVNALCNYGNNNIRE